MNPPLVRSAAVPRNCCASTWLCTTSHDVMLIWCWMSRSHTTQPQIPSSSVVHNDRVRASELNSRLGSALWQASSHGIDRSLLGSTPNDPSNLQVQDRGQPAPPAAHLNGYLTLLFGPCMVFSRMSPPSLWQMVSALD